MTIVPLLGKSFLENLQEEFKETFWNIQKQQEWKSVICQDCLDKLSDFDERFFVTFLIDIYEKAGWRIEDIHKYKKTIWQYQFDKLDEKILKMIALLENVIVNEAIKGNSKLFYMSKDEIGAAYNIGEKL